MKICKHVEIAKFIIFQIIQKFWIWSYEFHLVLKMISATFLKFDFVFSKFRFFETKKQNIPHAPPKTSPKHPQTSPKHPPNTPQTSPTHPPNIPQTSPNHHPNTSHTSPKHPPKHPLNTPQTKLFPCWFPKQLLFIAYFPPVLSLRVACKSSGLGFRSIVHFMCVGFIIWMHRCSTKFSAVWTVVDHIVPSMHRNFWRIVVHLDTVGSCSLGGTGVIVWCHGVERHQILQPIPFSSHPVTADERGWRQIIWKPMGRIDSEHPKTEDYAIQSVPCRIENWPIYIYIYIWHIYIYI